MLKMFRANDEDFKKLSNEIAYWSNGAGELSHRGEYDISEDELPVALKRVYNDLWSDEFGSICYLAETARGFGIALVKEYDETLAADHSLTMEKLYDCLIKDGLAIANHPYFEDVDVIIGEHSGFSDSHELIVFFPSDISKDVFRSLANKLDEISYSSLPAPKHGLEHYIDASSAPSLDMCSRSSLSEQIQSASTRATDSHASPDTPTKTPNPER